ncbi:hypothetical protein Bbelb_395240 [Branchiostoma belcheri]|nr:hypothetical protein Bbelb_395240 [Branchiostoma belcheri]
MPLNRQANAAISNGNHSPAAEKAGSSLPADKKLFTPGPLGVSLTTKQAMLRDLGSRDVEFVNKVSFIRQRLLEVAGVPASTHTCVPVQGSGTFAVEAVITTTVPRESGKMLVLVNGAYGQRMATICQAQGLEHKVLNFEETEKVRVEEVEQVLAEDPSFTNVAIVHCETSSGVVNPVEEVGRAVKKLCPEACYFVDAMSSFGAVPLDLTGGCVDFVVSSANKCIEGVPGFAYAICRTDRLLSCKGVARSLSLDLVEQYHGLEKNGQFRFTPPTHAMLAFCQALQELEQEGGVRGRAKRYQANRKVLREGMASLGFQELLDETHEGYIITSYHFPDHPAFSFKDFYSRLNDKGQVIYPGKVTKADCFRVGNIGHLFPEDMQHLLHCIQEVCADMGIPLPLKTSS